MVKENGFSTFRVILNGLHIGTMGIIPRHKDWLAIHRSQRCKTGLKTQEEAIDFLINEENKDHGGSPG